MKNSYKNQENNFASLMLLVAISKIGGKTNEEMKELPASSEAEKEFMRPILYKELRAKHIKTNVRKYSLRTAFVLLLCYMVVSISVFSVSAWRKSAIDFFLQTGNPYGIIQTENGLYINYQSAYFPKKIPEGFTPTKYSASDSVISLEYANSQNQMIVFTQQDSNTGAMIDTEGVQSQDIRLANGLDAFFIEKQGNNQLIWEVESYILILQSNLSKDEMLEIANSVPNK